MGGRPILAYYAKETISFAFFFCIAVLLGECIDRWAGVKQARKGKETIPGTICVEGYMGVIYTALLTLAAVHSKHDNRC